MSMADDPLDWIKKRNAEKKRDAERTAKADMRAVDIGKMHAEQGPLVWQRFTEALKLQAEALSQLEGEDLFGAATIIGAAGAGASCQVNVDKRGLRPELSRLVFHYTPSGARITKTMSGKEDFLPFELGRDDKISFLYESRHHSPEDMARIVIQRMADGVSRAAARHQ